MNWNSNIWVNFDNVRWCLIKKITSFCIVDELVKKDFVFENIYNKNIYPKVTIVNTYPFKNKNIFLQQESYDYYDNEEFHKPTDCWYFNSEKTDYTFEQIQNLLMLD